MQTLDYKSAQSRRSRQLNRLILCLAIFSFTTYIAAYEVAWRHALPAANMAYFVYSDDERLDQFAYVIFYPVQHVHRLFGFGGCQLRDRIYPTSDQMNQP